VRPAEDGELAALAPPKPLTVDDPFLGKMTWRSADRSYVGRRHLGPATYEVHMSDGGSGAPDFAGAGRQVELVERTFSQIRSDAAQRLFPTWDRSWRKGPARDAAWLAGMLSLHEVRVSPDSDDPVVYLNDGGAFGFHSIEVFLSGGRVADAAL
jgi:hypothetical protein